jgi:RimJ/RimL family protein N-acetyltransferase
MPFPRELRTERLSLTPFAAADGEALAAINADPEVTRYLSPLDHAGSLAQAERFALHWDEHGFGLWALRRLGEDIPIGFTGLSIPLQFPALLPAVEVGWRLRRDAWGKGYASEAARPAVHHGFADLGLDEVISLVHAQNARSLAVAARLGLRERERIGTIVVMSQTRLMPASALPSRSASSP